MGPPSGALRECQPGSPRVAYRRMRNPVHHAQARVGSTRGERDPLQLVEHSGDAAGVVPAIAHIPGRATLHQSITFEASDCSRSQPLALIQILASELSLTPIREIAR